MAGSGRAGWTTPAGLREASLKAWNRGELLREASTPTGLYPRRRPLRHPTATALRDDYAVARAWAASWQVPGKGFTLEHITLGATTVGANTIPCAAVFADAAAEIAFAGKGAEAARFTALAAELAAVHPELAGWAQRKPLALLKHGPAAPTAARVAVWMVGHPTPGIYLRQLALPGVHTKFVENHRGLIDEFVAVLAPERALPAGNYARRHGFLAVPERVRIRVLDPALAPIPGVLDLEVTADAFATLDLAVDRVIATENLVNFLALPPLPRTVALYGGGYGFEALRAADWLRRCGVLYWGDLDTHGFHILDQLRAGHPHVRSVLMDGETLMAHRDFWGVEATPTHAALTRLTADELDVYTALRGNVHGDRVRLEQEHIRWDYALERLTARPANE
ncbi:Wadjet anti-phage system protein JetD domain-containing protein [Specibacter cremeus]|uniref:Wadjet anti-phage system protein JetD domain-containing protein n=1 Tax=Specibacter cremeus TaxID=1629051 RepID=UPI000F7A068E|nr:DUF3322 and DUF2220 domain-containing protein [Specibacter cremeus]